MLKKIAVSQLRLGMHVHALDGPWLNHPFWRTKFVIADPADLQRLVDSSVSECWINPQLGLDVPATLAAQPKAAPPAASENPEKTAELLTAPPELRNASKSLQEELQQAAAICNRGRAAVVSMFNEARMGKTVDSEGCLPLVAEIADSVERNPGALVSLARLKTRHDYSYMHSVAVCALMVSMGRQMGMGEEQRRQAGLAGLMHDIGKAVMPVAVLDKPGSLTDVEFSVMRSHPRRGHDILVEGRGATVEMLDVVLHHHERVDGTGYPEKISGDAFTQIARMGAICDVYDAITSNRPYKRGWDPAESIARMAGWKGHLDPVLFGVFVRSLGIYPTGSLVRMASSRLAVVVEQNASSLVSPIVKVFFSTKSDMPIAPVLLDLSRSDCTDRIVGREQGADERFPNLVDVWIDPTALRRAQG